MRLYLYKLALWMIRKSGLELPEKVVTVVKTVIQEIGPHILLNPNITTILPKVKELVEKAETVSGASGEAKRHMVYAELIKLYPSIEKRDLSIAIEAILQGME